MKKTVLTLVGAVALSALSTSALARNQLDTQSATPGSGPNPFADCGIGAALFPKHDVLAVLSNVVSYHLTLNTLTPAQTL